MRGVVCAGLLAVGVVAAGCGGGERQDADEPEGTWRLEVVDASFPREQTIAQASKLKLRVRNADSKPAPNVAVTIETDTGESGTAPQAFSSDIQDPTVSDPSRPIWIVDKGPVGGETAYTNTWSLGRLEAGQEREFVWDVTAVKPGDYTVGYTLSPGLTGKARLAGGSGTGSFRVEVTDEPPDARVKPNGKVVTSFPEDAQ